MTMAATGAFQRARDQSFEDGGRRLVLVVGSGLHHHLAAKGVPLPASAGSSLRDWNSLLRATRLVAGSEEFSVLHHVDATATWESMVAARAAWMPRHLASQHEDVLLRRVRDLIIGATPVQVPGGPLRQFGKALIRAEYRDTVTLNFDRTIDRAVCVPGGLAGQVRREAGAGIGRERYRAALHVRLPKWRVWHAHGMADVEASAESIQLGLVAYSKSMSEVARRVAQYRQRQREWRWARHAGRPPVPWDSAEAADWQSTVRGLDVDNGSWLDHVLSSDIAFIGCGLDRAEADVWLLLHERQRQLARVPENLRPRAFFLHPLLGFPQHLATGPAGLIPVVADSHDHAWELVLGKWWS